MITPPTSKIHPAPFLKVLREYKIPYLRGDVLAGITVAVFAIPQAIACGIIADVPPIHGLYGAMVAAMVAALWGSCPYVNTGPSNSASLLTAAVMLSYIESENHLKMVFLFTLMVGIIRLVMGLVRMGTLIHFVPESAFLGFTMGVGSMIALGRLHDLMGIRESGYRWFPAATVDHLTRIGESSFHSLAVSLLALVIMFGLNQYAKRFPIALFAIAIGVLYGKFIPGNDLVLVKDLFSITTGLPSYVSPFFSGWLETLPDLAPGALAVAVVGLIEAVSIGQSLSVRHREKINFNQEFFGQGLSMVVSSFFQGIPGSGSFSRSLLLEESGARTFLANVVFGLATALFLLTLPGLINLIPVASLAALLLYIGIRLIDPIRIKRLWRTSRLDVGVMVATLFVTVFIKIEYGIFTGILLAAILLLQRSRSLHLKEILPKPDGSFEEVLYSPGSQHEKSAIIGLSLHGDLSYTVAHELLEQLNEITRIQEPEIIVLRIRQTYAIDFSSWNAIFDFAQSFQKDGRKLYLSGIDEKTYKTIHDARAHKWLPDDHLFTGTPVLMESFRKALRKAAETVSDKGHISGVWRDWLENPIVISGKQLRDIQMFLEGESIPEKPRCE